jgi:RNase P subunit RPR2
MTLTLGKYEIEIATCLHCGGTDFILRQSKDSYLEYVCLNCGNWIRIPKSIAFLGDKH